MLSEGIVGYRTLGDGAQAPFRQARTGEQGVSDVHGRNYEAASRRNIFWATNQAAQAVSVALTTTYTGLCVSNPLGNNKAFALLKANYALSVAPAAIASLHLIAGFSPTTNVTHTAALASPGIVNGRIGLAGGAGSTGFADTQATIVNPGYLWPMVNGFTAAALPNNACLTYDFGGALILLPGAWVAWGALTAVTGFGGFVWEEIPLEALI